MSQGMRGTLVFSLVSSLKNLPVRFDQIVVVISFQEAERPQLAAGKVFDFLNIWVLNESVMFLFLFVRMSHDDVFLFFL